MVRCVALIQFSDGLLLDMECFHYNTLSQVKSGFLVISVFILDCGLRTWGRARRRDTCYQALLLDQVT